MAQKKVETIEEKLSYREPMKIERISVWRSGEAYPVCPRCGNLLVRDYMCFCNECGQKLNWKGISRAQLIMPKFVKPKIEKSKFLVPRNRSSK